MGSVNIVRGPSYPIASFPVAGLPIGFTVYDDAGTLFRLQKSAAAIDGVSVFAVNEDSSLRWVAAGAASPPGTPALWFNAQNMDGTNNSSLIDGQAMSLWKNLGSLGAANDAVQATGINQPAFRLVAVPGAIGNKSAAECVDANRNLLTPAFTIIPQPWTFACVVRTTKVGTQLWSSAAVPLTELYSSATTDHISFATDTDTLLNASANQFHTRVVVANGASSFLRLDGTQSANLNPGANGFGTQMTLMRDTGSLGMIGFGVEFLVYSGGAQTPAQIEAYFTAKYGAFPQ